MKTLILFATYSGSTEMAAQVAHDALKARNFDVTMKMVADTTPEELADYKLIVIASPTWDFEGQEGMPHEDFMNFQTKIKDISYPQISFAILCLGDSSYAHFCGAAEHLENMVTEVKGKLVSETLKIDGYFYDQEGNKAKIIDWVNKIPSDQAV